MMASRLFDHVLLAVIVVPTSACLITGQTVEPRGDPTVQLHTIAGLELGVSTDYGVIFLGRGQRSGSVDFTVWFQDGPSLESGVIEPLGAGLFTTTSEIELPSVPLSFVEPPRNTRVIVRGRFTDQRVSWEHEAVIVQDDRVDGILLEVDRRLSLLGDDQIGAGVYVVNDNVRSLLGMVSGKLRLRQGNVWKEYVTVVGPRDLWRLVTHVRNQDRPRRWVHRDDIET